MQQTLHLDVIHNDDNFVVINKPVGVSVHKDQNPSGLTMMLEAQLQEKLFLVHRLDKVTSGLMVFAKHQEAAQKLSEQFHKRRVQKFYLALSANKPKRKQGLIIGDMEKSRRGTWKLSKTKQNPAITQFFSCSVKAGVRLFLLKPTTGKTHQIRVALKSEGAAIIGDQYYGGIEADRTYLHAYYLAFTYAETPFVFKQLPTQGELFDDVCLATIDQHYSHPSQLAWPDIKKS